MLKIIKREAIIDSQWNACIEQSSLPCIYAKTWFLDIVSPNWQAIIFFNGLDYEAVMPIPTKQKLGLIHYVAQPTFCQFLGIFSTKNNHIDADFLVFFHKNFKNISLYHFNEKQAFSSFKLYYNHVLDLNADFETLQQNFKKKRIKNIKIAHKYGWKISQSTDLKSIISIFKLNHEHQIGSVQASTYQLLEHLFTEAHRRGCAELYVAVSPITNQIEAGSLFWKDGGRLINQFCSASTLGRGKEARSLILNEVIRTYAGSNFQLDFETTNQEGFRRWNSSFGGKEVFFPVEEQVNYSFIFKQIQNLWRKIR
jgi:hypothetical protein